MPETMSLAKRVKLLRLDIPLEPREGSKPASSSKPHSCYSKEVLEQRWGEHHNINDEGIVCE